MLADLLFFVSHWDKKNMAFFHTINKLTKLKKI